MNDITKKLMAEFVGTFTLSLGVVLALSGEFGLATPVFVALILGIFVYSIGWLSGCHINPGVTLGLFSIKKITSTEALFYILTQFLAGFTVLVLAKVLSINMTSVEAVGFEPLMYELFGMIIFTFGIGAVVTGKVKKSASGLMIGASLLVGLTFSAMGGAAAILNPAVGLALGTAVLGYYLVQIIGGILGFQLAQYLMEE